MITTEFFDTLMQYGESVNKMVDAELIVNKEVTQPKEEEEEKETPDPQVNEDELNTVIDDEVAE